MAIHAALAAALAILTQAIDEPGADLTHTLRQTIADAKSAVASYLGLTVLVFRHDAELRFTAMDDSIEHDVIRTSLLVPLSPSSTDEGDSSAVILYAGRAGAFVDLAADLAHLTGTALVDLLLDQHLHVADQPNTDATVLATLRINQAIGVLIGRGHTPEQADAEIDALAARTGRDRASAADVILRSLT